MNKQIKHQTFNFQCFCLVFTFIWSFPSLEIRSPPPPPHPWGEGSTVVQKHCYTARKFAQSSECFRLLVHADGPDEVKQLTFAQPLSPLPWSLELVAIPEVHSINQEYVMSCLSFDLYGKLKKEKLLNLPSESRRGIIVINKLVFQTCSFVFFFFFRSRRTRWHARTAWTCW